MQLEVALERREPRRDDADLRVERADLAVDRGDLAGERALALLRPGDLRLHPLEARVDRLLAARDVAARRRRRDRHEGHEERKRVAESASRVTSSVRRASLPARAYSGCGGGLGAGVGSGTCAGPGGSDGSGVGSGNGNRLRRRARLRERLGRRGGRLDLGRLHLELRPLNPLHRVCGCSLHLFLLRADEPVELCHLPAGRFRPFLVTSVHRFAEHTGAFGPLRQQVGQLAAQPVELDAGGRVDGDRLDRVAGRLADARGRPAPAPSPA